MLLIFFLFLFNAVLGYPGEGLKCVVCSQNHSKNSRATTCKHLRWCPSCDTITFPNMNEHMLTTHGGWTCLQTCGKLYQTKRERDKCTCVNQLVKCDKIAQKETNARVKNRKRVQKFRSQQTSTKK